MTESPLEVLAYYMIEREEIRIKKEQGLSPPNLTSDKILSRYKFTNLLRSNDRTTRWVKKNWYDPNRHQDKRLLALNCAIFRYFGCVEFAEAIGFQKDWNPKFLMDTARQRMSEKKKVFTGAYIITNGGLKLPKYEVVVNNYLHPFREKLDEIVRIAEQTRRWEAVGDVVRKVNGMGAFMTKEILLDMMLTPVLENAIDKLTWTPVGPGAIRGLNRIAGRRVNAPLIQKKGQEEIQKLLTTLAILFQDDDRIPKIGIEFGVTDLQFVLCEFDKYMRVKNGEGRPRSGYRQSEEPLP